MKARYSHAIALAAALSCACSGTQRGGAPSALHVPHRRLHCGRPSRIAGYPVQLAVVPESVRRAHVREFDARNFGHWSHLVVDEYGHVTEGTFAPGSLDEMRAVHSTQFFERNAALLGIGHIDPVTLSVTQNTASCAQRWEGTVIGAFTIWSDPPGADGLALQSMQNHGVAVAVPSLAGLAPPSVDAYVGRRGVLQQFYTEQYPCDPVPNVAACPEPQPRLIAHLRVTLTRENLTLSPMQPMRYRCANTADAHELRMIVGVGFRPTEAQLRAATESDSVMSARDTNWEFQPDHANASIGGADLDAVTGEDLTGYCAARAIDPWGC